MEWVYQRYRGRGIFENLRGIVPVPPGMPDESVAAAVADLLRRHETLRTIFDADTEGRPRQRVLELRPPAVHRVGEIHSRHEFVVQPFDLGSDYPVRFGRLPDGGLLLVVAHMAADLIAVGILIDDLTELVAARAERRAPALGPPLAQPIDQALLETEGRGRAKAESALRYWADALPSHPPSVLPIRRCDPDAEVVHAMVRSSAALLAIRRLGRRYATSPATVLITAVYTALAIVFDHERVALSLTWSGRETPQTRDLVASLFRDMPLLVEFGDRPSFAAALLRTRDAMLRSARRMSFDVLEFYELAGRREADLGVFVPRPEAVNCVLAGLSVEPAGGEAPSVPTDLLADSELITWRSNDPVLDVCSLYFSAVAAGDGLEVGAAVDESYLSSAECSALVLLIERILVEAGTSGDLTFADAEAFAYGRPPVHDPQRWKHVNGLWVDLNFLTDVLCGHPAVRAAEVRVEDDVLVAYVTGDVQPWQLRDYFLFSENGRGPVLSPARFVVRTPDGATAAGPLGAAAESAIANATALANGLITPSAAESYLTAGGRLHLAPRVLKLLKDAGYSGLSPADLRRPVSLRTLAGRLRAVNSPEGPDSPPGPPPGNG
jgi:hypothetical protein